MVMVNYIINKVVIMKVTGNKIKWMDLVYYTIIMDLLLIKVNGKMGNLMVMELYIIKDKNYSMVILIILTLLN